MSISGGIHYYDPNTNQECHYQPPPTQYQSHYQTPPTSHYPANYQTQAAHYPLYNYTQPISRQATPDVLLPCPEPTCTGENKPKSKFCEECGRPLGPMSRSATPRTTTSTPPVYTRVISPPVVSAQPATYSPQTDPLQRAKGCPLVTFGFGGKILVTFPQRVPDYYANTVTSRPGPIRFKNLKDLVPLENPAVFPVLFDSRVGTKQKKKEIGIYINQKLDSFQKEQALLSPESAEYYRMEAKRILWQLIQVYVETEGHIDDKDKMDQAILQIIRCPIISSEDDTHFSLPSQTNNTLQEDDLSDQLLSKIEHYLLNGDRVGAVNYAIQEDLWAHALIISSCVGKDLWQKVITSFVDREMNATPEMRQSRTFHNIAGYNQPLRVLYSLFSGVGSAAMKEFIIYNVQYVNAPYCSITSKPIADIKQLSKWRDTLAIILANRTANDAEALAALGDIMKEQGWIEAAHICYLLSPQTSIHSGVDTMNVRLSLIGSDRCLTESIGLTEIYEFGHHLKHTGCLPFLQGYKLAHAWVLADYGFLDEARRYHEAVDEAIRSFTGKSPYLHQPLIDQLSAFETHLENATGKKSSVDPSSWLKPKFQKKTLTSLWGSLEGSFTKFVSGEEIPTEESTLTRKSTEIMGRYT
ncbi:hypothetical protein G6F57_002764 [Rhizopus arrhizus]|nr:hypothetical protein G6F57_002764 [Rhizopus arrhizus]